MDKNSYKNKCFSILGDSISTFEGISEPRGAEFYNMAKKLESGVTAYRRTWWGMVIDALGGELLTNNSISGSTLCRLKGSSSPTYACSADRTASLGRHGVAPDVIFAYIGTNDWGHGLNINQGENGVLLDDECVFRPAYRLMLERLRNNYPSAEIWCFTFPISRCSARTGFEFPYLFGGRHISEYCDAVRDTAREFGCRVIDLNKSCLPYDTIDCFHPNCEGMEAIAESVLRELSYVL